MKTLGIEISGSDILWIGIDGQAQGGTLVLQTPNRVNLPASGATEVENLLRLKDLVHDNLLAGGVEAVGIFKATKGCSPLRAKCELAVELACHDARVPSLLVAPQTANAAEKRKIIKATGSSFENAFNHGAQLKPIFLYRAAMCAWCVLQ